MRRLRRRNRRQVLLGSIVVVALVSSGCSYIARSSVSGSGAQGNAPSGVEPVAFSGLSTPPRGHPISADGRFVAFTSAASNLVAGDTNGARDVFLHDNRTGATELVSVGGAGAPANGASSGPALSADGRFVVFQSLATNLVAGDDAAIDVFVRDRVTGSTQVVPSESGSGNLPVVSPDGRFIAFHAPATDENDTAGGVFLFDRMAGTTVQVAPTLGQLQFSIPFFVSADNRLVGFTAGDGLLHLWDRTIDTIETFDPAFGANIGRSVLSAAISVDGRIVTFAGCIGPDRFEGGPETDVFVADRSAGTVERLFTHADQRFCISGDTFAFDKVSVSGDGRYVAFSSIANNLVERDEHAGEDVFVTDLLTHVTRIRSSDIYDRPGNAKAHLLGLSADGRYVAFRSDAALVDGDTNGVADVFTRFATPPQILSVGPSTVEIGFRSTELILTGTGFRPDTSVTISGENRDPSQGPELYLERPILIHPTQLLVRVITPGPPPDLGPHNLTVLTPGTGPGATAFGSSVCAHCVTLQSSASLAARDLPTPVLYDESPERNGRSVIDG